MRENCIEIVFPKISILIIYFKDNIFLIINYTKLNCNVFMNTFWLEAVN